jgi:DNA repair protein RAD16
MELPKNKGKRKAPQSLVTSIIDCDDLSEGAIVTDIELEYDEDASPEESDDSGSDFQASEDDSEDEGSDDDEDEYVVEHRKSRRKQPIINEDLFNDESDDEIMLDAAIQESLQTARLDIAAHNGTSSSSRQAMSSNPAASLRAAAAERRLAHSNQAIDVDDFEDTEFSLDSDVLSSSDEPQLKTKGKGKSATVRDTTSIKFMSISERRKLNREQRRLATASRKANKKEELAMVKLLGRRLTYVHFMCFAFSVNSFSNA